MLDEEKKGDSPKRVFISGQTTHITIEEEHPGGEDVPTEVAPDEDEDFDQGVNCTPAKHELSECRLWCFTMLLFFIFVLYLCIFTRNFIKFQSFVIKTERPTTIILLKE